MPAELTALSAAIELGGTTILRYVPRGGTFKFPTPTSAIYVNLGRGWYADASGTRYRTGLNTAVTSAT